MVDFISDPIANPVGEAQGFADVPSQAFQGQSWLAPEREIGALTRGSIALHGETDPETGVQITAPEPRLPAAELQKRYGVAAGFGVSGLSFTSDLPASVAADMRDAKLAEQRRADAAARSPDGIVAGVQRFGASTATQLLDPLGALSMMVPLGGEVAGASLLARGGSALVRGAVAGAAVTTPFVALHKLYADAYGEDYSAGDALREILMGSVLGGGLHAGATVAGDLIGRAFRGSPAQAIVEADPDIRHAAASEAVSAALDDRPPESADVIQLAAAMKARAALQQFADYQGRLDDQSADAIRGPGEAADQAGAAASAASDRLSNLRDEHAGVLTDMAAAQARLDAATDPATAERISAIDDELGGAAVPASRRDDLLAERDMLTQGARTTPQEDALEAARAQAELTGLQSASDRLGTQIQGAQGVIDQGAVAEGAFRSKATSIEGREALAQSLAERTLRRLAGTLGVDLAPDEGQALARSVLREGRAPADVVAEIAQRVRGGAEEALPRVTDGGAAARLSSDARASAQNIAGSIARRVGDGGMAPEDARAIRSATEASARAHAPVEVDDGELAELHDALARADEAGALDPEHQAELASIQEDRQATQSWIKALPQAAACILRSVL